MEFIKSRFPKTYNAQWALLGALTLSMVVQGLTYLFSRHVKDQVSLRMFMEQSYERFFISVAINLVSWWGLVSYRASLNLPIAVGLANINALSWIYMNG